MIKKNYCLIVPILLFCLVSCSSSSRSKQVTHDIDGTTTTDVNPGGQSSEEPIEISDDDPDFSHLIDIPADINEACPAWQSGETVVVTTNVTLPANCLYERVTLKIAASNVHVECNNAVFNGLSVLKRNEFYNQYTVEQTPQSTGIEIVSSEIDGYRLQNISVSNCQLLNYVNGIYIGMNLQSSTQESLREKQLDEQQLRDIAPTKIRFDNLKIINPHKHGVFLNRYITEFSLENSSINGAGNSAVYLESGSQYSTVKNNSFRGNGYSSYSRTTRTRKPRISNKARREGVAIDASQYNVIAANTFESNGDGGVYLYKNCWEHYEELTQLPRLQGANDNIIEGNTFIDETVGVWLAERADRNLANFECGDDLLHSNWRESFYRDYASRNIIDNNAFIDTRVGIRVQDNDNTVSNNSFSGSGAGDIEIGSNIRALSGDPVVNTTLDNNTLSRPDSIVYIGH